jgi:hypothetical protein
MNLNKKVSNMIKQTATNKIWHPLKLLKSARENVTQVRHDDASSSQHEEEQPIPLVVRFAPGYTVYDGMALCEYTDEEIAASWLSDVESDLIHEKCSKVIGKMEKHGSSLNENKYCIRGLERMTGARMDLKEQNRSDAYIAVLDLQEAQWKQGYEDQEQIAQHYQHISYQCQMEASSIGEKDELVVLMQNNKMVAPRRRTYVAATA